MCFFLLVQFCIHVEQSGNFSCRSMWRWPENTIRSQHSVEQINCIEMLQIIRRGRRPFWDIDGYCSSLPTKHHDAVTSHWGNYDENPEVPFILFPECVARVPVSLWGSGGWGCVRSTLRLWSQPSATVRNRSYELRMAVPMGSSAEVVIFGGFQCVVASFRVAGVALRDIQTYSATCRKSFCVAGAILLRRFQKMCCSFRGRRSTLDVSIVIFRGRRSTLDVSRCVFFANHIGRAALNGDKVQIPWQAWHFVTCAEKWRKLRRKHRFWCCKFSCSKENS